MTKKNYQGVRTPQWLAAIFATSLFAGLITAAQGATLVKYDTSGPSNRLDFLGVNVPSGQVFGVNNTRPSIVKPLLTAENIYAPCAVLNGANWNLYYGGWLFSGNGNDSIFMAVSLDGEPISGWYHTPPNSAFEAINRGSYTHVNDPNVVKVSGTEWYMAFGATRTGDLLGRTEELHYATSTDGADWDANNSATNVADSSRKITIVPQSGTLVKTGGRPAIVKKASNSTWYLWFNGWYTTNTGDTQDYDVSGSSAGWVNAGFLATSTQSTPTTFTVTHRWEPNDANKMMENDVKLTANDTFLGSWRPDAFQTVGMAGRSPNEFQVIVVGESSDGITWINKRIALNTQAFDPTYVSTTALLYTPSDGRFWGLSWGGSNVEGSMGQAKIYIGYNLLDVNVRAGSTWYNMGDAGMNSEFQLDTNSVNSFDQIQIIKQTSTGPVIMLDQSFTDAHLGDRWILYQ